MPPPHAYNLLLNIASRARTVDRGVLSSALTVFHDMVSRRVALTEASYASIIRICALAGDARAGAALLEQMKASGLTPRLRSYASLVRAFAAAADARATRALFADMAARGISPSQAEHAALLRVLAATGAPPAEAVAHALAVADDHPVLDEEMAAALEAALLGGAGGGCGGAWACARVRIDRASALCPATNRRLRAIDVSREALAALAAQTAALVGDAPDAAARIHEFRAWLAARADYDVLIDGPNVGFFGQNFDSGALMYSQIDAVRAHFAAQGRRVLIVIGEKWLGARSFSDPAMRRTIKRKTNFYAARARGEAVSYVSRFAATGAKHSSRGAPAGSDAPPPHAAAGQSTFLGSHIWAAPDSDSTSKDASDCSGGETDDSDADARSQGSSVKAPAAGAADGSGESALAGLTVSVDVSDQVAPTASSDSARAADIIARWHAEDCVYGVPRGFNDDWFWMLAAFSSSSPERVSLVSNDFMRDHHFQMLHSRAFSMWRERHQVRFAFCESADGSRRPARLDLAIPPPASLRIQEGTDGATLHAPLSTDAADGPDHWLAAWRTDVLKNLPYAGEKTT